MKQSYTYTPLKLLCYFVISVYACSIAGCDMADDLAKTNEIQIVSEISAARAQAFNEGNAAGIAIHFSEDALLMAPGKPATMGRKAVEAYYQSIFDKYITRLESHYEEVDVSGNIAYGRGEARVTLVPKKGGGSLVSTAKFLNILKKQPDGVWKTTHDIWNGNE